MLPQLWTPIAKKWPGVAVDVVCPELACEQAVKHLQSGHVLILGTDTLPGFHARADHGEAVARIQNLKKRNSPKPLLVLAGSLAQAQDYLLHLAPWQEDLCRRCWPGPFTLILNGSGRLAESTEPITGSLAVRVPDFLPLRELILGVGVPLVSTSVNIEGQRPCIEMVEAVREFGAKVDGFWAGSQRVANPRPKPSALVDLRGSQPVVIRQGPRVFPPA